MSRSAAVWAAVALTAVLLVFVGISLITSNAAWIVWSVVPVASVLAFFLAAIRGETLGEQKRGRDTRLAERKTRGASDRPADSSDAGSS